MLIKKRKIFFIEGKVILVIVMLMLAKTFIDDTSTGQDDTQVENEYLQEESVHFEGYTFIESDSEDLSEKKLPNVVVDIGFGERKYYAFTNEYGQVEKILADEVITKSSENNLYLEGEKYYREEETKVQLNNTNYVYSYLMPMSLGGQRNIYNISIQNDELSQYGPPAYIRKTINSANGCSDFSIHMVYSDTLTDIPEGYIITYTINGKVKCSEFYNTIPDYDGIDHLKMGIGPPIEIISIDRSSAFIQIKNTSQGDINLEGWSILSVKEDRRFKFTKYTLQAGDTVDIGDSRGHENIDFHWFIDEGIWNRLYNGSVELYDDENNLIHKLDD